MVLMEPLEDFENENEIKLVIQIIRCSVIILYLTLVKIQLKDKTYYKSRSIQPGLFTPNY